MVVKQMQVGPMAVFAYLIGDEKTGDGLVVDPASSADEILEEAARNNLTIRYIVNTHGHVDHAGGNADMKERTDADIVIHEDDAGMLGNAAPAMLHMFQARQSPPADITVRHGDTLTVGHVSLTVLHVPGHTPGGIALYMPGYVLTGDTLFVGAVGRTDLPGGSWDVMIRAITTHLMTLPGDTVVLPGHNYGVAPTSTIDREKATNPFLQG